MTDKKKGEKWINVGHFGWLVRYEHEDHWLDFRAYEVTSRSGPDNKPSFSKRDELRSVPGDQFAESVEDAEVTLEGYVKWDGCCEMSGPRPHFCGSHDVAEYAKVMQELHKLCLLLPSVDYDCAGYPEPMANESDG
jgi:hypothetical protein